MLTRAQAKQAASVAPWAELLPEVVQRIAELLDDKGRNAMLRTCAAWCAAIQAVPALWPEAVLRGGYVAYGEYGDESVPISGIAQSLREAADESQMLLEKVAALDALVWRVRVTGCEDQPTLVHALLAVLPTTVRQLRLQVDCRGPLLTVLRCLAALESFSIGSESGNGAHLQWDGSAAAAAAPKLTALRLDFREAPEWDGGGHQDADILSVPAALPRALAAATRLSSLELSVQWHQGASQLLAALPVLEDLRLTLYTCTNAHGTEAVSALETLPHLRTLSLTVHSGWSGDSEDPLEDVEVDEWEEWVNLPPMGRLANCVTALTLAGTASLPPDWRDLRELRQLQIINDADWASELSDSGSSSDGAEWGGFSWGRGSMARLTALTSLQLSYNAVLPDAAELATAPHLAKVWAFGPEQTDEWRQRLQELRPDLWIWGLSAPDKPAG